MSIGPLEHHWRNYCVTLGDILVWAPQTAQKPYLQIYHLINTTLRNLPPSCSSTMAAFMNAMDSAAVSVVPGLQHAWQIAGDTNE